jgi:hypothetical protein
MRTLLALAVSVSMVAFAGPKKKEVAPAPPAPAAPTTPYVTVLPTETESEAYEALLAQADALFKQALDAFVLEYSPPAESDEAAAAAVKAKQTVGFRVKLTLVEAREQMRASLLVTKIPGNGLRGSWSVHASGPEASELVEAIVPAIVADMTQDLGWEKKPGPKADAPLAEKAPDEAPAK